MKPLVTCHMLSPLDGRVDVAEWSPSTDAPFSDYETIYFDILRDLGARGYIVGRTTMEPYADGDAREPQEDDEAARCCYMAQDATESLAVVVDPDGKLHWKSGMLDGDHLVMVLGPNISNSHLCELAERGISYIVAPERHVDPLWLLDRLAQVFGGDHYIVAGGGIINGHFMRAHAVDRISLVILPSVSGVTGSHTLFEAGPEGLRDQANIRFRSIDTLEKGAVHLCYDVEAPDA
ncbi:dihydrofolate reductase family protein [Celeribacter litoreus]|uniref:dihydrofolate reductase family protein n=1 Tax=Celeribacter litoreus TaxID=2876714 RepID=UPI001CCD1865|nr:dihydrofolate reductase family protein [Celeribacter litoreus]MCA0043342.1 dihydrofolate reductase family protein [Celeribacter litoreus]